MNTTYYIGLDVHKDSIAIANAEEGDRKDAIYHGSCGGSNPAAEGALRKPRQRLSTGRRAPQRSKSRDPTEGSETGMALPRLVLLRLLPS